MLSCLCHPAACDLVQGLCFCPTRSSSSAVYPQDRSLLLPRNLSTLCLFQFCAFARQTACVYYSLKAIQNLPLHLDPLFLLTLTGMGIDYCINRSNTHWKKRSEWQRGIILVSWGSSYLLVTWLQCGKCLKDITNYKTPSPNTVENQQLADNLNEFYCRFEKTPLTAQATKPPTPPPALQISEDDVSQVLIKKKKKGTRPRRCDTSLSEILCWLAGPHLHKDLQQITGAV